MAKKINLIGCFFNNWKVIDYDFEKEMENKRLNRRHRSYWICQCKCGTIKSVLGEPLQHGRSKSCGCSGKTAFKDLKGKRFYDLYVLRRDIDRENIERIDKGKSRTYWLCQCKCGNIISVDSGVLRTDGIKHCGCKKFIDLKKKSFGYLTVLYRDFDFEEERKNNGAKTRAVYWKCECSCGTKKSVKYSHLVSGAIRSCGCIVSYGEKKIKEILNKYELPFLCNSSLKNAKSFKGGDLKFDFILKSKENIVYVLEFDGEQHFGYTGRDWSTKEHFELYRKNDILKNKYCFDNNIPIIRIPYVMLNYITLDDILLETSNFILTKENEKEYFNKYAELVK